MGTQASPEHLRAAADAINSIYEAITLTGAHEGHSLEQAGNCIVCSCGLRWQGNLASDPDWLGGVGR